MGHCDTIAGSHRRADAPTHSSVLSLCAAGSSPEEDIEHESNMVAIIVAFGIIVLSTLIVLAATIIAGRADAHAEEQHLRPQGTSALTPDHDHATNSPASPGSASVEICLASSDRDES